MNLTTATPVEIDTVLADLYGKMYRAAEVKARHLANAKEIAEGADRFEAGDFRYSGASWSRERAAEQRAKAAEAQGLIDDLNEEATPYHDEFTRRGGWTRFFMVPDGHVHSSMDCTTCNKNGKATQFGWLPEWSGRSEKEALAALVTESRKTILCTVCYPNAPVEWTKPREEEGTCPGSGTTDYPRETARLGYYSGNYGVCSHCGNRATVTKTGKMRKHKA